MSVRNIEIHEVEEGFRIKHKTKLKQWLSALVKERGFKLKSLVYIFCSDETLLGVNREYLQHDFYTDIITFDLSEHPDELDGEIHISYERVAENAIEHNVSFEEELKRVLAHGVLHLTGLGDKSDEEAAIMRAAEDAAIKMYGEMFHGEQ